jgi:hypothetical protein
MFDDDFLNLSIKNLEQNAQFLIKYRDKVELKREIALQTVDNYDSYINTVHDYYNALVTCRVLKEHMEKVLGIDDYIDEMQRVAELYFFLRNTRSTIVRKIRRTGIHKSVGIECAFCKSGSDLHSHHIIPLYLGGTDSQENFITVCSKCHNLLHSQISCVEKHLKRTLS